MVAVIFGANEKEDKAMPEMRACAWCEEINVLRPNAGTFCAFCFHRADCPRDACTCPVCCRRFWSISSEGRTEMLLPPTLHIVAHSIRMQDAETREAVIDGIRRNMQSPLYSPGQRGRLSILLGMIETVH